MVKINTCKNTKLLSGVSRDYKFISDKVNVIILLKNNKGQTP